MRARILAFTFGLSVVVLALASCGENWKLPGEPPPTPDRWPQQHPGH